MQNIPEIENLIKLISKLPGLGPKSAKRMILKMINNRQELLKPLAQNLSEVFKNVIRCKICGRGYKKFFIFYKISFSKFR